MDPATERPRALGVQATGMLSSLSTTAEGNAAIMRCGYSGFGRSSYSQPFSAEPQIVAEIEQYKDIRGFDRLVALAGHVVDQLAEGVGNPEPALLVGLPALDCYGAYLYPGFETTFFRQLTERISVDLDPSASGYAFAGRVGFLKLLARARQLLYEHDLTQILLLCADSLLNASALKHYQGDLYDQGRRLLGDDFSNGFIPGEAAVALLLGRPDGSAQTCITGIGFGQEPAPINSGEILRAKGLSEAIRAAAADAGIRVCETDFRISSANGEEYWFKEASLAQSRTLEEKRASHPLWHPADHIGEVGAAVGGAMILMAHYAFAKGYAPGPRALCQLSNDDGERGAFILERPAAS